MLPGKSISMRIGAVMLLVAGWSLSSPAQADVLVTVDKTAQRLTVQIDGRMVHQWPVSTARWGYNTPNGTYRPERLERMWNSRKYDWSPMPYSIFFHGGYAIHGSYEISRLGRPASHGCIRLHPENARVLFTLVQNNRGNTRIAITGGRPEQYREPAPEMARYNKRPAYEPPQEIARYKRAPYEAPAPYYRSDPNFEVIFSEPRYSGRGLVRQRY